LSNIGGTALAAEKRFEIVSRDAAPRITHVAQSFSLSSWCVLSQFDPNHKPQKQVRPDEMKVDQAGVLAFRHRISGVVVCPEDQGYAAARAVR
jgi:hypothetical protein